MDNAKNSRKQVRFVQRIETQIRGERCSDADACEDATETRAARRINDALVNLRVAIVPVSIGFPRHAG